MTSQEEAVDPALVNGETGEVSDSQPFLYAATSSTPWWVVSVLFHVLVIALAGLVSMAIQLPTQDDSVIVITNISKPPEIQNPEKQPEDTTKALEGPRDFKGTDPTSLDPSERTVTDEMLKLAKLGDHDETINLDKPNTHSAFGSEDAHIIYDMRGHDGAAGGGGTGGPSMEDMSIGVGAAGSPGDGGGFGGGHGTGIGTDTGPGFASRGTPGGGGREFIVKRGCGTKATIISSEAALRWLAYHQEPDGHWDTIKYGSGQKTDTAMTGMALLAFLGSGHTERSGQYAKVVKNAVGWLKSKQQANGLIFDQTDAGAHRGIGYPGAIATLALVEAAGMGNLPETRAAAQKAIDYCVEHQCGEGSDKLGWRYNAKQAGDTSVTGWFVMALKSAKIANLHVDIGAFEGALKFLKTVQFNNEGGDTSYGPAVHYGYQPGNEHASSSHRLTAIGNLIQIFMGAQKEQVQSSVEWFVNKGGVPSWGANGELVDMYYWYYGSLCTFQVGGDVWKRWNVGMMKALTENQCKQGDDAGSWPVVGEFSGEWGRVGQTALGCLSLEVYYRYKQMEQMKN